MSDIREMAIRDADDAWGGEGFYDVKWSDGGRWTNNGPVYCEDEQALANAIEDAYPDSTDTHLPYAEKAGGTLHLYEIELFVGSFDGEYDIDAIVDEITAISAEGDKYVKQSWLDMRDSDEMRTWLDDFRKPVLFEDCELEAYLGDYVDDFDYDALRDAVTYIDYKDGNRYWRDDRPTGDDFTELLKRFEK